MSVGQENDYLTQQNGFVELGNKFCLQQNGSVGQENDYLTQQNGFVEKELNFALSKTCLLARKMII